MLKTILMLAVLLHQPHIASEQITITNNGEVLVTVKKSDFSTPLFGYVIVEDLVKSLEKQINKKPKNARIDHNQRITAGKNGYTIDKLEFQRQFLSLFYKNGSSNLEVPKLNIYPKIDSELLETISQKHIGQYITYYNGSNKERSHNIKLATDAIDNYVVFPSETFSFNQVVGKRTKEKGYLPAPVIVKGELAEGIGGGICQVSSTLFNAVDKAGLKIVKRYSHSKKVPYVPPGRDATVSWYGPDFTFVNPYRQPVLLRARAINGSMIVNVYSSPEVHEKSRKVPIAPDELPKEINIGSS